MCVSERNRERKMERNRETEKEKGGERTKGKEREKEATMYILLRESR